MSMDTCSYTAPSDAHVLKRNTGVKIKLSHNLARFENNCGTDSLDLIPTLKMSHNFHTAET